MKKLFLILALAMFTLFANAQIKVISGGNVGINSSTPPARLTINGGQTKTSGITVKYGDVDLVLTEDATTNGGKIQVFSGGSASTIGSTAYRLLLQPEGGNVGIGITSPNNLIQVAGLINFDDTYYNTFIGKSSGASNSTGTNNTYLGYQSGNSNTTGTNNTFSGYQSGKVNTANYNTFTGSSSGVANTSGANNTFTGYQSGYTNTTGTGNTFSGYQSGKVTTTGIENTFLGYKSGAANTTASGNTFTGAYSGLSNTTGYQNTFSGFESGKNITTAADNTLTGYQAGLSNTSGYANTFIGSKNGYSNTTGYRNTFIGYAAGYLNTTDKENTYIGDYAGYYSMASYNTYIGFKAGFSNTNGQENTYIGRQSGLNNQTGYSNTALGHSSGSSNSSDTLCTFIGNSADANDNYSNSTAVGYGAVVTARNHVRIGNANVTQIGGQVGWSTLSDGRFKTNVTENVKGLEFINKLRPVTYQMNTQSLDAFIRQNMPQATDSSGNVISDIPVDFSASMAIVHSGFVAQEVDSAAQVCGFTSSIVHTPANSADPFALSYAEFVVPLVKAVQELSTNNSEQAQEIQLLKTQIDELNNKMSQQDEKINALETALASCCTTATPVNKSLQLPNSSGNNENINTGSPVLYQNIPNPFKEKTTIRYYLPDGSNMPSLLVFDMQGKLIKTYKINANGNGNIEINGGELQPGMYMYSLIADGKEIDTKKMILTE